MSGSPSYIEKLSLTIQRSLETFFYNWGHRIATRPWTFIVICILFSLSCSLGLISFTPENRPEKLWIPTNSDFVRDSTWLRSNFPSPVRTHYVILTSENVFQPHVLHMMYDLHKMVENISVNSISWPKICFRLPVTKFLSQSRRKRRRRQLNSNSTKSDNDPFENFGELFADLDDLPSSTIIKTNDFDPSIVLSDDVYCSIVNNLDEACWESNFVSLWNFDEAKIKNLTLEEIITVVNSAQISPVFGRPVNFTTDFGSVVRNETGHIVSAGAIYLRWLARINQTAIHTGEATSDLGTGEVVDKENLLWEKHLAKNFLNKSKMMPPGISMYFGIARSFGDISQATIYGDAGMLAVGFAIVFIYVVFMLGKFNFVEQRPFLSLAGLSCVGLAILVSYGLCSAFKAIYGPVHNVLPFLLIGIGIDDMFVIMQCWDNMSPSDKKNSLPERVGLTLKHAGVSITVTSITDFAAFAVGGTTVLPALQSFCIYAAVGVVATYIFQATFFVAWLTLDQRRIENKRNAFLWCIHHKEYAPNKCSQISFAQLFFDKFYSDYIFRTPAKVRKKKKRGYIICPSQTCLEFLGFRQIMHPREEIAVFTITGLFFGISIWGNILLRQEFNPIWFLPQDSYLFQYHLAKVEYFPGRGHDGFIFVQNVSYPENLESLQSLVNSLESSKSIYEVDSWITDYKKYTNAHFNTSTINSSMSSEDFHRYLGKFLFSPSGARHRGRIKVKGNLTCGESSPPILLTSIPFKFKAFNGPEEHLPAMRHVKNIAKTTNFTEPRTMYKSFAWSFMFVGWETDEIITVELYRNMALAMACVFITTLALIANFQTCVMVLSCVTLTLVDTTGFMHFWGLTIDTVSCIDLVLSIGLCVDYAAHIGHTFMTVVGTRNERAKLSLRTIGPAVVNGGFSTFLAFVLLANSRSHVFMTFFKIFFLVVVFGLFHGLVFLPVLLSAIGPPPYPTALKKLDTDQVLAKLNTPDTADPLNKENEQIVVTDPPGNNN